MIGTIEIAVDQARRRAIITLMGDVGGPDYTDWFMDQLHRNPALGGYDHILDLRGYAGRIGHDDYACLAPRYAALVGEADRGAVTVMVTWDEGFRLWAPVLARQFPHRAWQVVTGLASAEAVLVRAAAADRGAAAGFAPLSPADRARSSQ